MKIAAIALFFHLIIVGVSCKGDIQLIKEIIEKALTEALNQTEVNECDGKKLFPIQGHKELQNLFQKCFDKLKDVVNSLDPFALETPFTFDQNGYGIILNGKFSELIFSGYSSMNVTHMKVSTGNTLKFELVVDFDYLQTTGKYEFYSDVLTMLPLLGNGNFGIKLKQVKINTTMDFKHLDNRILQLVDTKIGIDMPTFQVDFANLLNIPSFSNVLNGVLNDIAPDLTENIKYLLPFINIFAKTQLNNILCVEKITLEFVIKVIKQFIQ